VGDFIVCGCGSDLLRRKESRGLEDGFMKEKTVC